MGGHWVVCGGDIVMQDGLVDDGAVVVVHGRIAWVGRRALRCRAGWTIRGGGAPYV